MRADEGSAAKDRYRSDGYVVVGGVVARQALAGYRHEADRLVAMCKESAQRYETRLQWEADYVPKEDREKVVGKVRKIEPVVDLSPVFGALALDDAICSQAAAVLGEQVVLFEDKLNLKAPGGSGFSWHQDWSCCWRGKTDELVTCMVLLDDADLLNGCLEVVPGSHEGKRTYPFEAGSRFRVDPAYVEQDKVRALPIRAGSMIVFDPYLLHFSKRNITARMRRSILFTYNAARLGHVNDCRFGHRAPGSSSLAADAGDGWVLRRSGGPEREVSGV